jgi:hypothetical protein
MTQFTANVKGSIVPPDFSVDTLPALFTSVGSSIHVQTSSITDFEGVSRVTALADGNTLSM